ncbi:hypothetical protein ACTIVE_9062 [Actinomadura verrucosospora]|uniref:Uncharacterized protein n=1 Tax=Actinomadura verrucosospora TaxID=46165 RepID=A0A7D4ACQ2_ACTVE|nr:hypothetical protein ACTIVE_9062 [Actinomadura verrucosospora]
MIRACGTGSETRDSGMPPRKGTPQGTARGHDGPGSRRNARTRCGACVTRASRKRERVPTGGSMARPVTAGAWCGRGSAEGSRLAGGRRRLCDWPGQRYFDLDLALTISGIPGLESNGRFLYLCQGRSFFRPGVRIAFPARDPGRSRGPGRS